MQTMNPVQMAEFGVLSTNSSIIVLELHNCGSSSRWAETFPSLPAETRMQLGDATFLEFTGWYDAQEAFERLTADCVACGPHSVIGGTITLVCRPSGEDDGVETHAWDLEDSSRPVFHRRGRASVWGYEEIADRI